VRVTVVGVGYVGLITGLCLASKGHQVVCFDTDKTKIEMLIRCESPIYEEDLTDLLLEQTEKGHICFTADKTIAYENPEVIIIAVGTPENEDGSANMKYFKHALDDIVQNISGDVVLVIKSTVPIATGDRTAASLNKTRDGNIAISVVSNPEFLSQGTAIKDMLFGDRIIVGLDQNDENYAKNKNKMLDLYEGFFQEVIFVNRVEAELIKYVSNCFLATKISFINEIANFSELVGANIDNIVLGVGADRRINKSFFKSGVGFGGSCFPKDLNALIKLGKNKYKYDFKILNEVLRVNNFQKIRLYEVAKDMFKNFNEKNVAILGLSYKANTNDTRESPAYENIDRLLKDRANISVYDPYALNEINLKYKDQIKYKTSIEEAIKDKDMVFIFADWDEIKQFPIEKYTTLMKTAYVFDGRSCYDLESALQHEVKYFSIGRTRLEN